MAGARNLGNCLFHFNFEATTKRYFKSRYFPVWIAFAGAIVIVALFTISLINMETISRDEMRESRSLQLSLVPVLELLEDLTH
jgi:hypothetical protein